MQIRKKYKGELKETLKTKLRTFCAGPGINSETFAFEKKLNEFTKYFDRVTSGSNVVQVKIQKVSKYRKNFKLSVRC